MSGSRSFIWPIYNNSHLVTSLLIRMCDVSPRLVNSTLGNYWAPILYLTHHGGALSKKYFSEAEKFFLVGWSQLQCFYPVPRGNNFAACEQYFFAYFLGHSIFQKGSILELLWMLVKSESPVDRWCIISPYFVGLSTILFGGFDRISQPVWSSGMTFHEANHPVTGRAFLKRGLGFINISRDW